MRDSQGQHDSTVDTGHRAQKACVAPRVTLNSTNTSMKRLGLKDKIQVRIVLFEILGFLYSDTVIAKLIFIKLLRPLLRPRQDLNLRTELRRCPVIIF
jgi:hypothetical protein